MTFHPRRFDRAARTYDSLSQVQERMADALLALFPAPHPAPNPAGPAPFPTGSTVSRILEMGCGTGHFTARLRLRFPAASLLATDASPRMLERTAARVPDCARTTFDAAGSEECMPESVRSALPFDLAASNALVQWFPDLGSHLRMVAARLAPGGRYLVSGFLRDNFPELNSLLAEEPFGHRDFPGHSREEVAAAASAAGFAVESLAAEAVEETFPDAGAFLAHIRGLGSSRRPVEGRPMTRERLELLIRRYQQGYAIRGPDGSGVRVTWKPWYGLLRKSPEGETPGT